MRYFDPYYHALLRPDTPRAGGGYLYDETQKGRFFIRTDESDEADTEADYFVVHFTLATGALLDGEVYLDGEFTHGRRDESTRLTYNPATRSYEKSLLLKQGAYNYRYLLQRPGRAADAAPIEGNFYETRNEYQIRIYHRPQGARYDRLGRLYPLHVMQLAAPCRADYLQKYEPLLRRQRFFFSFSLASFSHFSERKFGACPAPLFIDVGDGYLPRAVRNLAG